MFFFNHKPKSHKEDMDWLNRLTMEYRSEGHASKLLRSLFRIELTGSPDTRDTAARKKLAGARMAAGIAVASLWAVTEQATPLL